MVQRRLTRTNVPQLGPCLAALRVLASSKGPHRHVLIERQIDEYLRNDPFSLAHALERLRRAIQYEELERREGEDWSVAKERTEGGASGGASMRPKTAYNRLTFKSEVRGKSDASNATANRPD